MCSLSLSIQMTACSSDEYMSVAFLILATLLSGWAAHGSTLPAPTRDQPSREGDREGSTDDDQAEEAGAPLPPTACHGALPRITKVDIRRALAHLEVGNYAGGGKEEPRIHVVCACVCVFCVQSHWPSIKSWDGACVPRLNVPRFLHNQLTGYFNTHT